jgi:hypothetical protein
VPGEGVGTYAILQGTLSTGANYELTYIGNHLTIIPAPRPQVTASGQGGNPGLVTMLLPTPSSASIVLPSADIGDCSWAGIANTLQAHGSVVLTGFGACGVQ